MRAVVASVLAGMLALTGCAAQNPRMAAEVNGVQIAQTQVDFVADALAVMFQTPDAPGDQQRLAAAILVSNEVGRAVAATSGIAVSDADRDTLIASYQDLTALSQQPGMAQVVSDYAGVALIRTELGEEAFAAAAAKVPVTLNPRFGDWDPRVAQLGSETGSLSIPAPVG